MFRWIISTTLIVCAASCSTLSAQEPPQPAQQQEEHKWLQQLVGEWDTRGVAEAGPDQPAFECEGTEKIRSIGGLWIVADGEINLMGMTASTMLTLGYDPQQQKFIGAWVDSMMNHLWRYEGTLDDSGRKLTLLTEGPSYTAPGETAQYKEVLELMNKNEKVWTSYLRSDDGEWVKFMSSTAKRKK